MKRLICFFVCLFSCVFLFAQDFTMQWVDSMSGYIGKRVRDIPDAYAREEGDTLIYSRETGNGIYEGFVVNGKNFIDGIVWLKKSNGRSFLYSEFDRLAALITEDQGEAVIEADDSFMWNWNRKVLALYIDEGELAVMLSTAAMLDIDEDMWNYLLN